MSEPSRPVSTRPARRSTRCEAMLSVLVSAAAITAPSRAAWSSATRTASLANPCPVHSVPARSQIRSARCDRVARRNRIHRQPIRLMRVARCTWCNRGPGVPKRRASEAGRARQRMDIPDARTNDQPSRASSTRQSPAPVTVRHQTSSAHFPAPTEIPATTWRCRMRKTTNSGMTPSTRVGSS